MRGDLFAARAVMVSRDAAGQHWLRVCEGSDERWMRWVEQRRLRMQFGRSYAEALKEHRELRNRQIVAAVEAGADDIETLVAAIYPDRTEAIRRAAMMTVEAHVEHLAERGSIVAERTKSGVRVRI